MKLKPRLGKAISDEPIINLAYLQTRYPIFFRALRFPKSYRCNLTYWGIECGEGWMSIVDKAAAEIEVELMYLISKIKMKIDSGDSDFRQMLQDGKCLGLKFYELKEIGESPLIPYCKSIREYEGQLEISVVSGYLCDVEAWKRIREIVKNSIEIASHTCERCGSLGELRVCWWERVLCAHCDADADKEHARYLAELLAIAR